MEVDYWKPQMSTAISFSVGVLKLRTILGTLFKETIITGGNNELNLTRQNNLKF